MNIPTVTCPPWRHTPSPESGWAGHHRMLGSLGPPWTCAGSQRADGVSSLGWAGSSVPQPPIPHLGAPYLLASRRSTAVSSIRARPGRGPQVGAGSLRRVRAPLRWNLRRGGRGHSGGPAEFTK